MYLGTLDPVSNRASWIDQLRLFDIDDGTAFDISGATEIVMQVREPEGQSPWGSEPENRPAVLAASLANGKITRPETGVLQWSFTRDEMRTLRKTSYDVGITITMDDETTQIIIAKLPVLGGVVN